jgi:outer membrane protein assembly factor BamB
VSAANGCDAYGGAAVSGSTVFLPCRAGVRRADIAANGSIRLSWQATAIPGAPVVYGNAVLATSQATGRLYILDPTTGAVRTSMAVGALTRFATPALDTGRAYVGNMFGIVAVNVR